MNRETLPIDKEGNAPRIHTLEFDEADAPMLMKALGTAVCVAMMSGGNEARNRLRYYQDQFKMFAPPAAELLDKETDLCEIAIAGATATTWSVHSIRERYYSERFRVIIAIGERRFFSNGLLTDKNSVTAITEMIQNILPLTCEKQEKEDDVGNVWSV